MSDGKPEPQIFSTSIAISTNAKGTAQVDVKIYGNDDADTMKRAVDLYINTIENLKERKIPVAAEVSK